MAATVAGAAVTGFVVVNRAFSAALDWSVKVTHLLGV